MRDYRGEGGKKKCGIGNVRAEKWNEGDNRERSDNQRSVRQAKQEGRHVRVGRNILYVLLSTRETHA